MRRWMAALAVVAGLSCGGESRPAASAFEAGREGPPVAAPKVRGWAVVAEPARISLSPAGASLDALPFRFALYGHRVPVLDARDDVVLVVVDDGQVQLEVWLATTDLWRVTVRQARLHALPQPEFTFGFLTAGTEVTVLEEGAYLRVSVTLDDFGVEGYLRATDVGRTYQPAALELAELSSGTDFGSAGDHVDSMDELPFYADRGMSRSVNALLRGRRPTAFWFREKLLTLVVPRERGSFPRLVLELWTPQGWDACPDETPPARCGLVDPFPSLRDEPFELGTAVSRCDPSRMPEQSAGGAWVAAAGTCLWHQSVKGPVGMLLEPTALRAPRDGGRAELATESPLAGHGFFVQSE